MKTKLKAYTAGFLTCLMIISTVAWAATGGVMREVFYGVRVVVNGIEQNFAEDMQPFITGGRTFLPVRGIADALDLPVDWDEDTYTVYIGRRPGQARIGATHLNVVAATIPWQFDPSRSLDSATAFGATQIFNTLVVLCYDTMDVLPSLAVNWQMPDAQTVTMELRRGVYFHNGDPLTAHDVKFSLERAALSPEGWFIAGAIDYVTVYDDYNFTIHLLIPFAPILRNLAQPMTSIVPMNHVLAVGEDFFAYNPIGTGPFMFDHMILNDRLWLVGNPNYWNGAPQIENLIIRVVPDASTRLIEVADGTTDIALSISHIDADFAEEEAGITLLREPTFGFDYIGFNVSIEPWSNPLVMQAMNYALGGQRIGETVFGPAAAPITSHLPPSIWGYAQVEPFTHNIDRARELMAEAGYADGFGRPVEIWWNIPNRQRQQIGEFVQFYLALLNIEVLIVGMEWSALLDLTGWGGDGEHDMFTMAWIVATGDADYGLYTLFHSSNHGAAGNRTFTHNRDLDRLLEAGRAEIDPTRRAAIYAEALQILRDHPSVVPIRQHVALAAISDNLRGFSLSPTQNHRFCGVYFVD